jgi:hypothetical protein
VKPRNARSSGDFPLQVLPAVDALR